MLPGSTTVSLVSGVARIAVAAAVLSSSAGVASASPRATGSPQALYAAAWKAGHAQRSVHWSSRATSGAIAIRMDCDVARTSGIQRIGFTDGSASGKATVVVVGGNAYLRGDAVVLTDFMGFDAAAAATYAGRWIEVPKSDRRFADVAAGVTLSSAVDQVAMVAPFRRLPNTVVRGQKVVALAGKAPGSTPADVVFYARPGAPHLPVGAVSTSGSAGTWIMFSRWNEPVRVSKPAGAVPIGRTGL